MAKRPILRQYPASALCTAAGCSAVTLRAWRNRNGLFPECQRTTGWNYFSRADIAAARVVVVLTERDLSAQMAVDVAMRARPMFERMFSGDYEDVSKVETIIVIKPAGRDGKKMAVEFLHRDVTLIEVFGDLENEASIVIEAVAIASHVSSELNALDLPPIIATREDSKAMVLRILADAIRPDKKPRERKRVKASGKP
jgi:hypothetical protein